MSFVQAIIVPGVVTDLPHPSVGVRNSYLGRKITNSVKESCKSSVAGDEKMGNDSIEIRPQDTKELGRHSQIFSPVKRYCAELLFYVPSAADRYSSLSTAGGAQCSRMPIVKKIKLAAHHIVGYRLR